MLKSFLLLPIVFAFLTAFLTHKKIVRLSWIALAYFSCLFMLSLLGIGLSIAGKMTFDNRLALFFDSPNHFAMLLAPALLVGWWLLKNLRYLPPTPGLKKLIWLGLILVAINLVLAQSLGAWIGLAAGGASFFAITRQKNNFLKFAKTGVIAVNIAGLILILNASFFTSLFGYNPSIPAGSFDSRIAIYQAGEKIIKNQPLAGFGPGNFQLRYLENQTHFPPYPQWAVPHAHNNFVHIWTELGFFAFLTLFLLLVIRFFQKQKQLDYALAVSIIASLFTHGIIDTTIWHNDLAVFFWFLLLV